MQILQLPNFIYSAIHKLVHNKRVDGETELNDLSYKDVLFDVEMRSLLHTAYEDREPPSTLFPRLEHAIRLHEQEQEQKRYAGSKLTSTTARAIRGLAIQFGQAMMRLYRVGSNADISRILSQGLVAALLVLAIGPNMLQALSGPDGLDDLQGGTSDSSSSNSGAIATVLPTAVLEYTKAQRRLLLEQKVGEDFDAPYQQQEVRPLDPTELRSVEGKVVTQRPQPSRRPYPSWPQ